MAAEFETFGALSEEQLQGAEQRLGYTLPDGYRRWLAATNGAAPRHSVTLPDAEFLWEDRAFGLRPDAELNDLVARSTDLRDRLTAEYLPVAEVSGGLLALKIAGDRRGSVWFWDDDDPRATDADTPEDTERLLVPLAETWDDFIDRLTASKRLKDELRALLNRPAVEEGLLDVEDRRLGHRVLGR